MSTLPDNELDLEKLFLPAWAQDEPSAVKYAKYEGRDDRPDRFGDRRGPRPPGRGGPPGGRREGDRPRGERRGPGGQGFGGGRPPGGERRGPRRDDRGGPGEARLRGDRFGERREPPPPLPELNLSLVPDERGVESLARQIKMTGRAYPLFDIAQMILQKPERHSATFSVVKNPEGKPVQPLFVCVLDDTLWLSEDEAVAHVLKKHFGTFYQAERTATEPPKGKYTFVAQCGMSGTIFGPPNHHDYQNQLRKLHSERFSRMPFEVYKARVKIVRDEEVVKKWVEEQSWKTEYICLNMPEPLRLPTMEEVEKHFRQAHKDTIIKQVESHTLNGAAARALRSSELSRLLRNVWEDQRRFPLQIATVLSQQFASHGLQFFKVNKTVTHVAVARPHYLDLSVIPVSETVKRIVEFINSHPKCTRKKLVEALAPTPAAPALQPIVLAEIQPASTESQTPSGEAQPAPVADQPPPKPEAVEATPEQTAIISDLHWLIHQGHVIEFATGILETAKKPLPKPPKPEPKTAAPIAATESPVPVEAGATRMTTESESVPAPESTAGEASPLTGQAPAAAEPQPQTELAAPEPAKPVEETIIPAQSAPISETPGEEASTPST
jgi:hypothetical protein